MKTGGMNTRWVTLERPKPPRVADHRQYWTFEPIPASDRCQYWMRQIDHGWRPNRFIRRMGVDEAAEWFGVYICEYTMVIWSALYGYPGTSVVIDGIERRL